MLDQQHRLTLRVELLDALDDQLQQRRVDACCRLVEQDRLRVGHQHAGKFEQLALTARKHAGWLPLKPRQSDEIEQGPRLVHRRPLLRRHMPRPQKIHPALFARLALRPGQNVLQHSHLREGPRDLKGATDASHDALFRPFVRHVVSADPDRTVVWLEAARQQVEEGCLAGAVWPDQPNHLSLAQLERHLVDRMHPAEATRHLDGFQDRSIGRSPEGASWGDDAEAAGITRQPSLLIVDI